jgi:hypothetical protein
MRTFLQYLLHRPSSFLLPANVCLVLCRVAVEGHYSSAPGPALIVRLGRRVSKVPEGDIIAALTNKPVRPIERFRGSKQARFPPC